MSEEEKRPFTPISSSAHTIIASIKPAMASENGKWTGSDIFWHNSHDLEIITR